MSATETTVLGIQWNTKTDTLRVASFLPAVVPTTFTKRTVLQFLSSIFDPLGYFAPAVLPGKLFLQGLWTEKLDWDAELSLEQTTQWRSLLQELAPISAIQKPRYLGPDAANLDDTKYELHCYCDASGNAYGACVYIRISSSTTVSVHLLFAKSRLAPKRVVTLPRLELLAATIGNRCLHYVEKALSFPIQAKFLWSDSQCVLHWIRSTKPLSVFVSNRVREIRQSANVIYRYVNTQCNPADLASRGTPLTELQGSALWWHGPEWLSLPDSSWPCVPEPLQFSSDVLNQIMSETKPATLYEVSLLAEEDSGEKNKQKNEERSVEASKVTPYGIDVSRFSSLSRLLRVTAWCNRFVNKAQKKAEHAAPNLTAKELNAAKTQWIRATQKGFFPDVLNSIESNKRHPLKDELGLWLDETGILRCKGRLTNADLTEEAMFPKLLPKKALFTTLVVRHYHENLFHAGVAHTLSQIRREFWIPAGRSQVFKCIRECRRCRRFDGGPYRPPQMPALPESRVTKSVPFTWTGLDYLGPLYVKGVATTSKVWICLFTCMATRAAHLELVEDLSAAQFLLCLRRFVARRGRPEHILSDNAAQFKLAKTTLDCLWQKALHHEDVQSYLAASGIHWSFIVERAPWMGGFYERLVRLVKQGIRKSIQGICLTIVQLQTIVTEIEAMLNSRPLTYVGSDVNDGTALTPAHFLSLNPKTGVPPTDSEETDDPDYQQRMTSQAALLAHWAKGQKHLQNFWKIWKNEYLQSLRERTQTNLPYQRGSLSQLPRVGDVVHLKGDLPRGSWQVARIKQLCTSADGAVRSAKVVLPSGKIFHRALTHLYPLECSETESAVDQAKPETPALAIPPSIDQRPGTADEKAQRPQRQAAKDAITTVRTMIRKNLV